MTKQETVEKTAEKLKSVKEVAPPEWSKFVKTGANRERVPWDAGWWYKRAASILNKLAKGIPIGVGKFRMSYGGMKNRGFKPERFYKASGKVIRTILQQLEKAGFVERSKATKKGRILTKKGSEFLK